MNGEERRIEAEILENLRQGAVVPAKTEEKLQAAYDVIRARCDERRNKAVPARTDRKGQRKKRKVWPAVAAAAVLAASSLCAAAAGYYFDKNFSVDGGEAAYSFEVNYDLKPVTVTAEPGYLPDGMEADGAGKYYPEGEYGHGISIIPINTLNMEQMRGSMSFENVEKVEEKVIQGMEAHIILFFQEQKYRSGKHIFLFNPQEGYVLWLYGDYNIPAEELEKVAENLQITVEKGNTALPEEIEDNGPLTDDAFEEVLEQGIRKEEITAAGQELDCADSGCGFTVLEAKVYDSILDVPGYTEAGAVSQEQLALWLNEDGTHKPYRRIHYDQNGIAGEEQTVPKFLAVTMEARQYGESIWGSTPMDATLERMVSRQDGTLGYALDDYQPVPDEDYELQLDGRCFYMEFPEKPANAKDFFYKNLKPGEKIKYTMIFAVDSDLLEKEDTVLLLKMNAAGSDPYAPQYSALLSDGAGW